MPLSQCRSLRLDLFKHAKSTRQRSTRQEAKLEERVRETEDLLMKEEKVGTPRDSSGLKGLRSLMYSYIGFR